MYFFGNRKLFTRQVANEVLHKINNLENAKLVQISYKQGAPPESLMDYTNASYKHGTPTGSMPYLV
jgi:hypothetical protein